MCNNTGCWHTNYDFSGSDDSKVSSESDNSFAYEYVYNRRYNAISPKIRHWSFAAKLNLIGRIH